MSWLRDSDQNGWAQVITDAELERLDRLACREGGPRAEVVRILIAELRKARAWLREHGHHCGNEHYVCLEGDCAAADWRGSTRGPCDCGYAEVAGE